MNSHYPRKLKAGDEVRIIAPSDPLLSLKRSEQKASVKILENWGLKVSFGANAAGNLNSKSERLADLHAAFTDKNVKAVIAAAGGYNANELIDAIDYDRLGSKFLLGYSDITVLCNAINAQTGMTTYYGPNLSGVGSPNGSDFTREYLHKILFDRQTINYESQSHTWYDKIYSSRQVETTKHANTGWWVINQTGIGMGRVVGGHLGSFLLLGGTPFAPSLKQAIVCVEVSGHSDLKTFRRQLYSLTQQKDFHKIEGLMIGRFQTASRIAENDLRQLIDEIAVLKSIPVIANLDFGHTSPKITLPIGGEIIMRLTAKETRIIITAH